MNRKVRLAILACVSVSLMGCGRVSSRPEELPVVLRDNEIALRVINQNYYDARLFARWRNGHRQSIGHVPGFNEETFVFRWQYFDLQVEINLLSVGIHYTPWMNVERGDELELVIDPALDRSIRIRRP
jgi:hypothetical protein